MPPLRAPECHKQPLVDQPDQASVERFEPDNDLPASDQPLGDCTACVAYRVGRNGGVTIEFAVIEGGVVQASAFSQSTLDEWAHAIEQEIAQKDPS